MRFEVGLLQEANQDAPDVGDGQQTEQALHDHMERHVRVLAVEDFGLECTEEALDAEPSAVPGLDRHDRAHVAGDDEGLASRCLRQDDIHRLTVYQEVFTPEASGLWFQSSPPVVCLPSVNQRVPSQADTERNPPFDQPSRPVLADAFPVGIEDSDLGG